MRNTPEEAGVLPLEGLWRSILCSHRQVDNSRATQKYRHAITHTQRPTKTSTPPKNNVPTPVLDKIKNWDPQEVLYKGRTIFTALITVIFYFGCRGYFIFDQKKEKTSQGGALFGRG